MSPGPCKQFDRQEVLEKAMRLFWRQGYEATGMAQLLEHVGIGRQSLYDTFGDKRGLFLESLAHYHRTRVAPIVTRLRAAGPALGNIRKVFTMWGKMSEEAHFCGCMIGNTTAELAPHDTELSDLVTRYYREVEDAFHDCLSRAHAEGDLELRGQVTPRDLARTLVHTVQGVALLTKVFKDRGTARSVMRASMAMLGVA